MTQGESRPQYPIGTAARRIGLSPHVLRAWERRYGAVTPARPVGGRRLYSDADIRHFRLLRELHERGHGLGQIAGLGVPELLELVKRDDSTSPPALPLEPSAAATRHLEVALAALKAMDDRELHSSLTRAAVALSSREFVSGLVLPLLRLVGQLWAEGAICPAQEHILSVRLARVLGWVSDTIPIPAGAPNAVSVTPSGQRHEFGALLAGVVAAEEGWRVTYLGSDLPTQDIATAAKSRRADLLLLSALAEDKTSSLATELRELRTAVGTDARIFIGGQGAEPSRAAIERAGGRWLADLDELRAELRGWPLTVAGE